MNVALFRTADDDVTLFRQRKSRDRPVAADCEHSEAPRTADSMHLAERDRAAHIVLVQLGHAARLHELCNAGLHNSSQIAQIVHWTGLHNHSNSLVPWLVLVLHRTPAPYGAHDTPARLGAQSGQQPGNSKR